MILGGDYVLFKRLLGSYILIILITVGILGVMINVITEKTFSQYVKDQTQMHGKMLPIMLSSYYSQHGNWEGVQDSIEEADDMTGAAVTLVDMEGSIVASTHREHIHQTIEDKVLGIPIPILYQNEKLVGTVYIERYDNQQRADEAFISHLNVGLFLAVTIVFAGAIILGWFLARSISEPLVEMSAVASQMSKGNFNIRMTQKGSDEMITLKKTFHQMVETMKKVEERRRKLIADVSHEMRTPLTVIQGYLESLRYGNILDRLSAEKAFKAMHKEVNHLLNVVEDLRDLSVIDAGVQKLQIKRCYMEEVIQDVLVRIEPLLQEKQIQLEQKLSERNLNVPVDRERMNQVLYNMLNNALQHTPPKGKISIRHEADKANYRFMIEDNGKGIPPEHLPYIFERFYRVDEARSHKKNEGAGIGLSIVKSIVEAHHGTIDVESEVNKGSIFIITLPMNQGKVINL